MNLTDVSNIFYGTILGVIVLPFLGKISYFLHCFSCLKVNVFMTFLKKSTQNMLLLLQDCMNYQDLKNVCTLRWINILYWKQAWLEGCVKDMQHTSSSCNEWHITLTLPIIKNYVLGMLGINVPCMKYMYLPETDIFVLSCFDNNAYWLILFYLRRSLEPSCKYESKSWRNPNASFGQW